MHTLHLLISTPRLSLFQLFKFAQEIILNGQMVRPPSVMAL